MKRILILSLVLLVSLATFSQRKSEIDNQSKVDSVSIYSFTVGDSNFNTLLVGSLKSNHSMIIHGDGKSLNLDFKSGKLIVTGDMEMDEAAIKFIDYCKMVYGYKIDSLENIILELRNNVDILSKTLMKKESTSVTHGYMPQDINVGLYDSSIRVFVDENGVLMGEKMKPLDEQYIDWCDSNKIIIGYKFFLGEDKGNSLGVSCGVYYEVYDSKYAGKDDSYIRYRQINVSTSSPENIYYYWEEQQREENPQYFKPQKYIRAEPIRHGTDPTFEGFIRWKKKNQ